VPAAFGKLLRGEVLHVWGDGSAERDYLYIDDFTRLVLAALDTAHHDGFHIFNACNGGSIDLNGLFALIERVAGQPLRRTYDAGRPVDAPSVWMQAARARRTFGWLAKVDLSDGLERTWRWFSTLPR
jgi:UDP-glucose 4-epimerase